jgi:hypothetical protein
LQLLTAKPCRTEARPTKESNIATPLATSPLHETPRVACHCRVRVPDGRIGTVIGFYRRDEESVLVSFSSGGSGEFLLTDVERL